MKTVIVADFNNFQFNKADLTMIIIYKHPEDFPNHYVGRMHTLKDGATPFVAVKETLNELRNAIPSFFYRMNRQPDDQPHIVEVWI